jgi:integral membrane sensor domain MASE1
MEIATSIRKMAHVPTQVWKGWDPDSLFSGWFFALGEFKTLIGVVSLILGVCLMLPCLVPLVLQSIRTIMEATTERKMAAHIMMLWKYKPLNQDDAL